MFIAHVRPRAVSRRGRRRVLHGAVLAAVASALLVPAPAAWSATSGVQVYVDGPGTVSGDGISCSDTGGTCHRTYEVGEQPEVVQFTAVGRDGFALSEWEGCHSVEGQVCTVEVSDFHHVTASFVDVTDPVLEDLAPSGGVVSGTVTVSANASDNHGLLGVRFDLGASSEEDVSAPYTAAIDTTALADGPTRLTAVARDPASRSATLETTVVIDNTAPVVELGYGPWERDAVPPGEHTWSFEATEIHLASRECRVYRVPGPAFEPTLPPPPAFGPCSAATGHTSDVTTDGTYVAEVRVTDTVGHATTATSRTFRVDGTAPVIVITHGPAEGNTVWLGDGGFTVDMSEYASLECRLQPAGAAPVWTDCTRDRGYFWSSLTPGSYAFEVRGTDLAGNTSTTRRTFVAAGPAPTPTPTPMPTLTPTTPPAADTTAPDTTWLKTPRARVRTAHQRVRVTYTFSATEAGSRYECRLDGGAWRTCSSPRSWRVRRGRHVVEVRAVDAAGNVDATPARHGFRVLRRS